MVSNGQHLQLQLAILNTKWLKITHLREPGHQLVEGLLQDSVLPHPVMLLEVVVLNHLGSNTITNVSASVATNTISAYHWRTTLHYTVMTL